MRPEHSETKTETRECENEIETETETSPVKSSQLHMKVTQISRLCFIFYYAHKVNDEPEMDFAFKMISK